MINTKCSRFPDWPSFRIFCRLEYFSDVVTFFALLYKVAPKCGQNYCFLIFFCVVATPITLMFTWIYYRLSKKKFVTNLYLHLFRKGNRNHMIFFRFLTIVDRLFDYKINCYWQPSWLSYKRRVFSTRCWNLFNLPWECPYLNTEAGDSAMSLLGASLPTFFRLYDNRQTVKNNYLFKRIHGFWLANSHVWNRHVKGVT